MGDVLDGEARSLVNARKASRMKDEKEVKELQKPVVRLMINGVVFLTLPWGGIGFSGYFCI